MDIKKIQENIKVKISETKKSLQSYLKKILKKKKAENLNTEEGELTRDEDLTEKTSKIKIDPNAGEKKAKHNFTEQDLKRKKIIQIIVVISIAIFLFVEDEEIVEKVQKGVKQVKNGTEKVLGGDKATGESELKDPYENLADDTSNQQKDNSEKVEKITDSSENAPDTLQDKDEGIVKIEEKNEQENSVQNTPIPIKETPKERKKSLLDMAKIIEKKAEEESRKKVYKTVNYLKIGRGLAYNCKKKFWACINKREYFNCQDNLDHLDLNKKERECYPLEVFSSVRDCKIIQIHKINTIEKTGFCKGQ
jgi:hypothetical protein